MNPVPVIAYFAGDPSRTYQLVQWLEVLESLDHVHQVGLVLRDPASASVVRSRTQLPVFTAETLADLADLYAALDPKVVLYCNNSPQNFDSLLDGRRLHVHVNHGESDKQSMASNNAKAYDRVFVAGEAAVQRYVTGLLEFDASKLVRVGRPQLDLRRTPLVAPSERRTVLYAPTWEGDADYNDYTSVDTMGESIVRAILAVPDVQLVYKPHPKVTTSRTPSVAQAHLAILELLAEAALRDPGAGHTPVVAGDILAVMLGCDAIVTDVSSVGLDWLYLHTDRPIFLTDRHGDVEQLRQQIPISRCADVVEAAGLDGLTALLGERLDRDEHQLSRMAMRHHYFDDLHVGDSTARFLGAVSELVALCDQLLGELAGPGEAATTG
ncbi:CDP-Glycerol:Poly(glycerophosphate) glycerophosphotransferase [Nocardioides alpinus]|uniref:CDP-Glycerol:Poly(Glycerophosphate) glycerophosphotransferase n=1 Tax=Nocardioides alpinus TaxID=748909 RepID=A0A1I1AIZ1_9ACTN|nr:CDP-glycerol glycerophosphotransferase family protein [Nocardioides alpinus]PKH41771.1 CDP-glycerol--glycerophosphate glycerophosphotransferase [Nocardioides alpinus]SFB37985.1 CDP-Glycerol:Poly(glycerophosphate) glycerophosphotransferase [Nocardioides alpinus]